MYKNQKGANMYSFKLHQNPGELLHTHIFEEYIMHTVHVLTVLRSSAFLFKSANDDTIFSF